MSNKELKTRIQMKNDTADNWATASTNGFIPKLGEPIFYRTGNNTDGYSFAMKIGDNIRTAEELPFFSPGEIASEEDIDNLFDPIFSILYCTNRWDNELYNEPTGGNAVVRLTLGPGVALDNNTWRATLYGYNNTVLGPYTSTIEPGGMAEIDFEDLSGEAIEASGYRCYAIITFSINGMQYEEVTDTVYYP